MMRQEVLRAAAALWVAAAAAPCAALDTPIPPDAKVAPDPAMRTGVLPNGLRYAVMPNDQPSGAISIRLAINVGSFEESEDELGYAHFIEHMAFRSTKQAPEGSLDTRFGGLGVALGRDQNAVTTLASTVYKLDLAKGGAAGAKTALEWMRGAADGILFTPEAVAAERGVVLSELRAGDSPIKRIGQEIMRFQLPSARGVARDPGGTPASLLAATPDRLRAFHARWYRPDNALLVIVGAAPADQLVSIAEETFGSWRSEGAAPSRAEPAALPAGRGLDAIAIGDPAAPPAISACRFRPPLGRGYSLAREREQDYSAIWSTILNTRFQRRSSEPGAPAVGSAMMVNYSNPDAVATCLVAVPNGGKWKESLSEAEAELRRFAKDGPTEGELEKAVESIKAQLRAASYQSAARQTASLADGIVDSAQRGLDLPHPEEALRVYELVTAGVTAGDVRKAFERDWSGSAPILAATAAAPPKREDLIAAWTEGEKSEPLSAYSEAKVEDWPYWDFGRKGGVERREKVKDGDYVRYRFRNGTILNVKPTALESGGVNIVIRFGYGERGLSEGERRPAELAAALFPDGGLGKLDYQQIDATLSSSTWGFSLSVEPTAFVVRSKTLADQVDQQMRVLAAYFSDPGFRPVMDEKLPTVLDMGYRLVETDPSAAAQAALDKALFPNQPSLPPRETLAALRASDMERLIRGAVTGAPVELTVVGDVTEKEVKEAVRETFAALPARTLAPPPAGPGPFRRFPGALPPEVTGYHSGPSDKAAALIVWPLYVADPDRRSEEYALQVLAQIFQMRLVQRVRVDMGKVYSPAVSTTMPDWGDQGSLTARVETSPADLDLVVAAARGVAAQLAEGRFTKEEIDGVRGPLIAARQQLQQVNAAWAGAISGSTRDPRAMRELLDYQAVIGGLTLDQVKAVAARWLSGQPITAKGLPRLRGAAAAPSLRPGAASR